MTPEVPDSELARLFQEERRDAEASAPGLNALLARPRRRPARMTAIRVVALAAALAAVAAAALLLRTASPRGRGPESAGLPSVGVQLATWKAPTDVLLLSTPGSELWTRVPVLVQRVPAPGIGVSLETTKGVER